MVTVNSNAFFVEILDRTEYDKRTDLYIYVNRDGFVFLPMQGYVEIYESEGEYLKMNT